VSFLRAYLLATVAAVTREHADISRDLSPARALDADQGDVPELPEPAQQAGVPGRRRGELSCPEQPAHAVPSKELIRFSDCDRSRLPDVSLTTPPTG
jgi:hypothetical protein